MNRQKTITVIAVGLVGILMGGAPSFAGIIGNGHHWDLSGSGDHVGIKVYNQDQLEGNWKQFKGELKKRWGKFTDDDLLYMEGKKDKLEGKIQERYGEEKEEVTNWIDKWFDEHEHGTESKRN